MTWLIRLELACIECSSSSLGLREEEADVHHSNNMDTRHDRDLLRRHVVWASLRDWDGDCNPDCVVQRSNCHCQCP